MSPIRLESEMPAHHWAMWMARQFRKGNNLSDDDPLVGEPVIANDISITLEPINGREELSKLGLSLLLSDKSMISEGLVEAIACHIVMVDSPNTKQNWQ